MDLSSKELFFVQCQFYGNQISPILTVDATSCRNKPGIRTMSTHVVKQYSGVNFIQKIIQIGGVKLSAKIKSYEE